MRQAPDPKIFNQLVWTIVKQIPEGKVSTYGQIASMIPPPDGVLPPSYDRWGAQWVGGAMNVTPSGQEVPWQRVINSKGMISIAGSTGVEQRALLEDEGVEFDDKDRVNFEVVGWDGPEEAFIKEHNLFQPRSLKKNPGGTSQPRLI